MHVTGFRLSKTLVVAAVLAVHGVVAAQAAVVYRDIQFTGASLPLSGGYANPDLAAVGFDNAISSVRILDPRYDVILYMGRDYGGERFIVGSDETDLRAFNARYHWNDQASSLRVVERPVVEIWSLANFTGTLLFRDYVGTSRSLPSQTTFGSVRIIADPLDAGCVVRFYPQVGYQGTPVVVLGDEPDYRNERGMDVVGSWRIERPSGRWQDLPLDYPIRANPAVRASYGNQPVYRGPDISNYTRLATLDEYERNEGSDWKGVGQGHNGTDIGAHSWRAVKEHAIEIRAAADGRVVLSRDGVYDHMGGTDDSFQLYTPCTESLCDGSGNFVYLLHENGFVTQYAHLMAGTTFRFPPGTWVPRGTLLGFMGSSGASTGPHLHFGVFSGQFNRDFRPREFSPLRRTDTGRSRISRYEGGSGDTLSWGTFVCPWFQEPGTGEDMWATPAPSYRPQDSSGPYGEPIDVFDVRLTATRPWLWDPADETLTTVVGQTVWADCIGDGGRGLLRLRVTDPYGNATVHMVPGTRGVHSFVATIAGDYRVEAQRQLPGTTTWETRAEQSVRVFPGTSQYRLTAVTSSCLRDGTTQHTTGEIAMGDLSDGVSFEQALVGFPPFGVDGQQILSGHLQLSLRDIQGTNPFEKRRNGVGWAGRLHVDIVSPHNFAVLQWNAAQLDPAHDFGDSVMEGGLKPEGLDYIMRHPNDPILFRLRFEYETNRNRTTDLIRAHGHTSAQPPVLTLFAKPSANIAFYGSICSRQAGTPIHTYGGGLPAIPNPSFEHAVMDAPAGGFAIYALGTAPIELPMPVCPLRTNADLLTFVFPVGSDR
ncbi:MAG TPA: M23 family metallopeptidase, partial [Planctomycetota bacterium]|nr:M23 family metallopeptidase [Planctomycetota bacterium]